MKGYAYIYKINIYCISCILYLYNGTLAMCYVVQEKSQTLVNIHVFSNWFCNHTFQMYKIVVNCKCCTKVDYNCHCRKFISCKLLPQNLHHMLSTWYIVCNISITHDYLGKQTPFQYFIYTKRLYSSHLLARSFRNSSY